MHDIRDSEEAASRLSSFDAVQVHTTPPMMSSFEQELLGLRAKVIIIFDDEIKSRPLGRHVSCEIVTNYYAIVSNILSCHRLGTEPGIMKNEHAHPLTSFLK